MDLPIIFIPVDRRFAIAEGVDLPDRCHGAVLFADISGFTPLTETLARELGPKRGADELTKQLDSIYGALIGQVERYHGSVISFAGDAITCWYDGDDGLRAAASAFAMQQAMRDHGAIRSPGGTVIPIAVKVVIASGSARRFWVGDPQIQYLDTLAGAILDRIGVAEHYTEKGEVVVTSEVAEALGDKLEIVEWRSASSTNVDSSPLTTGDLQPFEAALVNRVMVSVPEDPWPPLPSDALTVEQVRPWILPSVYDRLNATEGRFVSEIRLAVPLFMRFSGIDYDHDEMAGEKLDGFVRRVQGVLTNYGGALLDLEIGDKGSVLYGAFGAPIAHDDDALRAVAASLDLMTLPSQLDYIEQVQLGITQGRTRAGPYGSPTRRSYGVHGDQVNLAARLMSKANPGEVLVNQRVAQIASRHYDLRELGSISVKGKRDQVLVSLVLGPKAETTSHNVAQYASPLVGREKQLKQASETLNSTISGMGQVLRIEGAAGLGKSHLAAELARRAEQRGVRIATGACQSTGEGIAYLPWRQVFRTLLALSEEDVRPQTTDDSNNPPSSAVHRHPSIDEPNARLIASIEARLAQRNQDWLLRLPLFGDLLGIPIPDNATTAAFDPKLRQSALFDLLGDMLESWAEEQPLLLLLDDVHWMDVASQDLTVTLARRIADLPVLIAVVSRPPFPDEQILPGLDTLAWHHTLSLDELSSEAVAALIANHLGGPVSSLALSLIQSGTQGNPFFVEEVVDSLRESSNLLQVQTPRSDEERWNVGTLERSNVEWVLSQSVIDALREADCLLWVDGQWVLAPNASLASITLTLELPDSLEGVVLSRIDRLPEAHKLTLRVASVIGHTFTLDLLARVHPMQLSDQELSDQIHTLEARDFTRLESQQANPVYIFKHNVTHDVAYDTLLHEQREQLHRSVGVTLETISPDEVGRLAYHMFAGEDWPHSLHYQKLAGQQAQRIFANHEAIEHFKKALLSADKIADEGDSSSSIVHRPPSTGLTAERQQIHLGLGELLTTIGQYEQALERLEAGLALSTELSDNFGQACACRWMARAYENRGEYTSALEWIDHGLDALGSEQTSDASELLAIAGLIHTRRGDNEEALKLCEESLAIGAELDEPAPRAFASNARGVVFILRGDNTRAIEDFQNALRLYGQAGNIFGEATSHNQIANVYFNIGKWSEADYHYRQSRHIFNQVGAVYNLAIADNNLGGIALNRGRLDEALAYYQDALRSMQQLGSSPYVLGVVHMNLGATYVRRGEVEAALRHLQVSQEYFEQAQARDFLPEMHRHLAEAALFAGELDHAEEEGQQAADLARELAMRGEEGSSLRVLGEIAEKAGETGQAESRLAESLTILQEVGDEYEAARTELALAELYLSQGKAQEGSVALERSTATLQRLDAAGDLARAEELGSRDWGIGISSLSP